MAYIDRDKAIAYVEEQYRLFKDDEGKQAIVEGCVEALKFTPTADVEEVRHGEWEYNKHQAPNEKSYFCSLCAEGESDYGKDKYCPSCGAKMDGGKNENLL